VFVLQLITGLAAGALALLALLVLDRRARSPLGEANAVLERERAARRRQRRRLEPWRPLPWLILASLALAVATWALGPLVVGLLR
jgi:hypothetical protein